MSDQHRPDDSHRGPQLLEALLNSAVGAIITIDEKGIVYSANPATENLFGYRAAEIIGRNVRMLMPEPHRARHDGYLQHHIETGQRKIIGIGREVEGQRKDGTRFPMHLSVSKFEVDGQRYFAGIVHDLTARNEAKAESSKQQSLFKAIFNNVPDAMVICYGENTIILCNAAVERMFGYRAAELQGLSTQVLHATRADATQHTEPFAEARKSFDDQDLVLLRRKSGEHFPGTIQGIHIREQGGTSLGYLLVIRDLSREVTREQALRKAQRLEALGQLTGGIAHDFNNLLTIITGNHELLETELTGDSQRDLLRRANSAALMGARLTSRLLTFARKRPLESVLLNLNEQVLVMKDLLRRTLGEQVVLSSTLAPRLWPVRTDPSEIENAVLNFAINARDAMPSGGRLILETRNTTLDEAAVASEAGSQPGEYVCLSVSDTGTGMTPDVLARVFEPFFTTKEAGRGTGLGLSVVYGFARQSGGHVSIYSEPGHGTTVNLYLPRAVPDASSRDSAQPRPQAQPLRKATILVVEDQAQVRDVTLKRLIQLGYEVEGAESAVQALLMLDGRKDFDLVFSDVVMPGGMSGFDLARWLQANRPEIKVLLTSGFAGDLSRAGEPASVGVDILRKPYDRDELSAAIQNALADLEIKGA